MGDSQATRAAAGHEGDDNARLSTNEQQPVNNGEETSSQVQSDHGHDNGIAVADYGGSGEQNEPTEANQTEVKTERRPSLVTDEVLAETAVPAHPELVEHETESQPIEVPTLIGEKTRDEVRSEMGLTGEEREFIPDQEQLIPQQADPGHQEPAPQEQIPQQEENAQQHSLPWESEEPSTELPWDAAPQTLAEEINQLPEEEKKIAADLPWETDTTEALPWETQTEEVAAEPAQTEDKEYASDYLHTEAPPTEPAQPDERTTPEGQTGTELPWDSKDTSQADLPWESNGPEADLPWESKDASSEDKAELTMESKETSAELPWESKASEELPWESKDASTDLPWDSQPVNKQEPREALPLETTSEQFGNGNAEEAVDKTSKPPLNSLDDLLAEDELLDEDLDNTVIETKPEPAKDQVQQEPKEPVKELDFLDDDDLLLDDDLLEEESKKEVQPVPPTASYAPQKRSYVPSAPSTTNSYQQSANQFKPPQTSAPDLTQKLTQAKKKNDAYDFPIDLMPTQVKPAPRTHNPYAPVSHGPGTQSASASTPGPAPRPLPESSVSPGKPPTTTMPPPAIPSASTSHSSSPALSAKPQPKKSFFEDLPISIPQKDVKPARAGSYTAAVRKSAGSSPNVSRQSPQLHKPVVNPYAVVSQPAAPSPSTSAVTPVPPMVKVLPSHGAPQPPANGPGPVRKASNPTPTVNTNLVKTISGGSQTSPYIPTAGPYAPNSHNRAHSRTNSLIGGKGKEHNPYAPALPPVSQQPQGYTPATTHAPNMAAPSLTSPRGQRFPAAVNYPSPAHGAGHVPGVVPPVAGAPGTVVRPRGVSNPKTGLYGRARAQSINKVQDPAALLRRQFPIFHWNNSNSVSLLIPAGIDSNFHSGTGNVQIRNVSTLFPDKPITCEFPGPLGRSKGKKKDLEKWIENNIGFLQSFNDPSKGPEILLNKILLALSKYDGDIKNKSLVHEICKALNPSIDYNTPVSDVLPSAGVSPNANKLDQSGVNHIFLLIQTGRIQDALQYTMTKGDWALALILGVSIDKETFNKVASDYARISYPFQKSNNKVHHMMPVVLKIYAGNGKAVIEDFKNVPSEGEWFAAHWSELVATVLMNTNASSLAFLHEFGKYLKSVGNTVGSECCYIISGTPLAVSASPNEGFSFVGSFTTNAVYSEIYEYVYQMSPLAIQGSPHGFLHLLPLKLRHAQTLTDYGCVDGAQKYADYIGQTLKTAGRNANFTPQTFNEFQKLMVRISDAESNDSSWFGGKISKVNLDKMWGHLDKFIGGEEPKPSSENGVFSKFSPSVSRVGSVLDFTAPSNGGAMYNQMSPQNNTDGFRDPIAGASSHGSAPEYTRNASYTKNAPFPLGSTRQGSIQQPLRTPLQENIDSNSVFTGSPGPFGPPHQPYANSRYAPSNTSSEMINDQSQSQPTSFVPGQPLPPPLKRGASKYAPGGSSSVAGAAATQRVPHAKLPYQNLTGAVSTSSVGSYSQPGANLQPHNGVQGNVHSQAASAASAGSGPAGSSPLAAPNVITQNNDKRPSISSILSTDNFANNNISHHSHSASIQSDISLDYPSEFRAGRRESEANEGVGDSPEKPKKISPIEENTEGSTQDVAATLATSQSTLQATNNEGESESKPVEASISEPMESVDDDRDAPDVTPSKPPSSGPPPKSSFAPPPRGTATKRGSRVNPYAPGGTGRKAATSKYSAGNKYSNPNSGASSQYVVPQVNSADMFQFGGYQGSQRQSASGGPSSTEQKVQEPQQEEDKQAPVKPEVTPVQPPAAQQAPQQAQQAPPAPQAYSPPQQRYAQTSNLDASPESDYRPPQLFRNANIDDSFELPDSSELQTPKPKPPLMLNNKSPGKDSMFMPYQGDTSMRRPSAFGIDSTFNEFPIPGSPDVTTRANSVVNGMGGGLFSSRLSQSQQSAMYQQYEVQDDTVHDYVPVVEEEDEDSDDERASKRKKQEEERRRHAKAQTQARGAAAGAQSGRWLSWLNRGNDDKPKPVRAKLGEQNKFVYDEKLKRWINKDIPLEEQLAPAAPPPPPKKKMAPAKPGVSGPVPNRLPSGTPMAPNRFQGTGNADPAPNTTTGAPGATPSAGGSGPSPNSAAPMAMSSPSNTPGSAPPAAAPPGGSKPPSLATAGLDDLLSMGGSTSSVASARKSKRGGRRGYVNVLDQK